MQELTLFNTQIKITDEGLISLTDMHKAAMENGSAKPHQRPVRFLQLDSTKAFIAELSKSALRAPLKTTKGKYGGTYGDKFLAYKYAAYLDPAFEVGVYNVIDKYFSGELLYQPYKELNEFVMRLRVSEEKGSVAGRALNDRKNEKKRLETELSMLQEKYQIKLGFVA